MAILSHSEVDGMNQDLAERLNEQMTKAVMPVTVFVGIETVLGFFGNLIVLYVFLFRYHSCNFRYFVLCLAIIDIISTLTTMPGEIVTQLYWYVYPVPILCKVKSFINVFTVSSDTLCFLAIAVDRYRKVCKPLDWQIQPRIAKFLCIGIYVLAVIIAVPCPIFWGTHEADEFHYNQTITTRVCAKDEKYLNSYKPLEYSISIEILLSICLACMLVLYFIIARKLIFGKESILSGGTSPPIYGSNMDIDHEEAVCDSSPIAVETSSGVATTTNQNSTDTLPRSGHHQVSIEETVSYLRRRTLIMFILTVTFVVTILIYLTMVCFIADGVLPTLSDNERALYFFFFRFYFINHVINPIVYGVLDPKFREVMSG